MTQATAADFMCIGIVIGIGLCVLMAAVSTILKIRQADLKLLEAKRDTEDTPARGTMIPQGLLTKTIWPKRPRVPDDQIDDKIDEWHTRELDDDEPLHNYLGMTWEEYREHFGPKR